MQVYFAALLMIVALALGGVEFVPSLKRRLGQTDQLLPVALTCLWLVALLAPQPVSPFFKAAILLGLLTALLAALFYKLPGMAPYVALAFVCLMHIFYFVAFASTHPFGLPTLWILLPIAWAGAAYWLLHGRVHEEWGALIGLIALTALMLWQAFAMWTYNGGLWAILGLAGALLLAVAGTLLLVNHTRRGLPRAWLIVSLVFGLSHTLISWSVWGAGLHGA